MFCAEVRLCSAGETKIVRATPRIPHCSNLAYHLQPWVIAKASKSARVQQLSSPSLSHGTVQKVAAPAAKHW